MQVYEMLVIQQDFIETLTDIRQEISDLNELKRHHRAENTHRKENKNNGMDNRREPRRGKCVSCDLARKIMDRFLSWLM